MLSALEADVSLSCVADWSLRVGASVVPVALEDWRVPEELLSSVHTGSLGRTGRWYSGNGVDAFTSQEEKQSAKLTRASRTSSSCLSGTHSPHLRLQALPHLPSFPQLPDCHNESKFNSTGRGFATHPLLPQQAEQKAGTGA